jgi:uncharacterized membrane protein YgdD (TMEM256/DUF423 family)
MKAWIWVAASFAFSAVVMGAFGAHAVRGRIADDLLAIYQTGVLYHLIHALALWTLVLVGRNGGPRIAVPASLFALGIVLFSGSLYVLALSGQRWLGAVTPFGGLSFLAGWVLAAVAVARAQPST